MKNLARWARNHSTQRRTDLTSYSEISKIALEIDPVHVNIPNPRSRGTYTTKLDDLAKLVLVSLANHLNTTIWKIPHPARYTQLPCQVGDPAAKENALYKSRDQNSRASIQTHTLMTF